MQLSTLIFHLNIVVVSFFYLLGCAIFSFSTNSTPMRISRIKDFIFSRYSDICLLTFSTTSQRKFNSSENDLGQYPNKIEQKHFPTSKSFQHVGNVNTIGREFIPENCFSPQFTGYTYLAASILDINQTRILITVHSFMGLVALKNCRQN